MFGVILKVRNKEMRKVSVLVGVIGLFGIIEFVIYGVILRFKKLFIFGCMFGVVGVVVVSFFYLYYFVYVGFLGLLMIVNGINE